MQCGVWVVQNPDYSTELDLLDYAKELSEIKIDLRRAAETEAVLTGAEMTRLRPVLGQLRWLAQ